MMLKKNVRQLSPVRLQRKYSDWTVESLCNELSVNQDELGSLVANASWTFLERQTSAAESGMHKFYWPSRIWLCASAQVETPRGKVVDVKFFRMHYAFIDSRYSGATSKAGIKRAAVARKVARLNAAQGNVALIIEALNKN